MIHGGFTGFNDEYCWAQAEPETDSVSSYDMKDQALIEALLQLKDQKVNLGIAFGERDATARMLGNTASRLARALMSLKKGRFKHAARELGVVPKNRDIRRYEGKTRGQIIPQEWLALQYGWKPLLSDVYGAYFELNKREVGDFRITVKGRKSFARNWSASGEETGIPYRVSGKGTDRYQCRIDAIPKNDFLVTLNRAGIFNPLQVAWELVPFSFVYDWFIPIGDYLSVLDAWVGYSKDNFICHSLIRKKEWAIGAGSKSYLAPGSTYSAGFSGKKRTVLLERTVDTGTPLPSFPRPKNPASLAHMANGLSLLATALARDSDAWNVIKRY
jgi:hypothetical protein